MLLVKKRVGIFVFKMANNYGLFIPFIMNIKKFKTYDFIYGNINAIIKYYP